MDRNPTTQLTSADKGSLGIIVQVGRAISKQLAVGCNGAGLPEAGRPCAVPSPVGAAVSMHAGMA